MRNKYLNSIRLLGFSIFIFVVLPVIHLDSTIDPELAIRFFLSSAAIALFAIILFFTNSDSSRLHSSTLKIFWVLAAILGWTAFSMIQSINPGDATLEWLRLGVLYSLFFCALFVFNEKENASVIVCRGAAIATVLFSFFAILQLVPLLPDMFAGKTAHSDQIVSSTLANKNFFSEVLVLLLPFVFYGLIYDSRYWKILFGIALFFNLSFIVFLQSLSSWIALCVSGFIFVVLTKKYSIALIQKRFSRKGKIAIFLLLLIALSAGTVVYKQTSNYEWLKSKFTALSLYLSNPNLLSETRVENNNSLFERFLIWRNSVRMIEAHPFFGVGLNNWKILNPSYGLSGTQYINSGLIIYEHPHNDYLLIWAEQGLPGLIVYLMLFFFMIRFSLREIRNSSGKERTLLILLTCGIISFLVMSLFAYPRSRFYSMILLMIIFALILSNRKDETKFSFRYKYIALLVFLISSAGAFASRLRLKGEIHTKALIIAQQQKNFARLIREADKASSWFFPMDLTSTPIGWYKGMAYFYSGNLSEAKNVYEQALLVNPYHLRLLNDLGTVYEQSNERQQAISCYKKALAISTLSIEVNLNLSAAYFNGRNVDSSFYFIDRIYNLPMSWKEEQDYAKFLDAILYSKSYIYFAEQNPIQNKEKVMAVINNKKILMDIYKRSKSENRSFTKLLDEAVSGNR